MGGCIESKQQQNQDALKQIQSRESFLRQQGYLQDFKNRQSLTGKAYDVSQITLIKNKLYICDKFSSVSVFGFMDSFLTPIFITKVQLFPFQYPARTELIPVTPNTLCCSYFKELQFRPARNLKKKVFSFTIKQRMLRPLQDNQFKRGFLLTLFNQDLVAPEYKLLLKNSKVVSNILTPKQPPGPS